MAAPKTRYHPAAPAELEVRVNGEPVGRTAAPAECGTWSEFRGRWDSGDADVARVEIFNLTTAFSGNDFAIDDVSLRADAPAADAPRGRR